MNRLLSGLRSRALKSIELSRGLGAAEDYGDCNWGTGLGQFTMSVVSGLRAGGNGGGASMRKVLLLLNGRERAAEPGFVEPDTNGLVTTAGSGDQVPCLERCHSVLSCRWSGGPVARGMIGVGASTVITRSRPCWHAGQRWMAMPVTRNIMSSTDSGSDGSGSG